MIKINENFTYEVNSYNWVLYEWRDGTSKKGKQVRYSKISYHNTLSNMLLAVMDKSLKNCLNFDDVSKVSEKLSKDLERFLNV